MPTLGGVPLTYSHELRGELLFNLCAALTREGLGTPAIWKKVSRFVALNRELFLLVEEIEEWEKRHEGSHLDRGEPSFRAA
jgi:hypothetical protein